MFQNAVLTQDRVTTAPWFDVDRERVEVARVLERAAGDNRFIAQLTHHGPDALRGYNLSLEAQAALLGGDIHWIEARVGKLNARLRTWLDCRLQQEIW